MLYCRYIRDKVNYLLYIICLLLVGTVSMGIFLYGCFLWPNN